MIGVYYPYLACASKWEELRYSLRSLERFFRGCFPDGSGQAASLAMTTRARVDCFASLAMTGRPYVCNDKIEVWIVGDLPEWIQNVRHIPHHKAEGIPMPSTFDAVSKLWAYIDHAETPERFVRMYDDVYFVGERTAKDLEVTRFLFTWEELKREFVSGSRVWQEQVMRSAAAVKKLGYPGYMTETHCPEVFEKGKMKEIFARFDPAGKRLLTSTLYYNVFPFERMLKDRKAERVLYYGYENEFSYGSTQKDCFPDGSGQAASLAMTGKYFLNHNDAGLDENLKEWIKGMFPEKSRWEK